MYWIDVSHEGLHKFRRIRGSDRQLVEQQAVAQKEAWDEMWERRVAQEEGKRARLFAAQERDAKKQLAADQTTEAQATLHSLDGLLADGLRRRPHVNWNALKERGDFPVPPPSAPAPKSASAQPKETDTDFQPRFGFIDWFFPSRRARCRAAATQRFEDAQRRWSQEVADVELENAAALRAHEQASKCWEQERAEFQKAQEARNAAIDSRRALYEKGEADGIRDYYEILLTHPGLPDYFPQEYEIVFIPENRILLIDYALPEPDVIPRVKEIKYVASKDEFVEVGASDSEANKRYDSILYQVALRTMRDMLEADGVNALAGVVFNGWVRSIDPATGKEVNACILSVQAEKSAFLGIDLARVDPKACFKALKGVGSSKLHSIAAVAPVLSINRSDSRFVTGYAVADELDSSANLAAMDWQDFENLIREVFEKEFAASGGEVKVTRASRDRGVDAIAFDPDPIRGGKIVIQAKRYTNTVDVSAVRDLYGTVLNEGASKGILVTTSDYGPDAYEFVKGKPLTLLNGSNLLSLLEKHGHRARIDLREARVLLVEENAQRGDTTRRRLMLVRSAGDKS